MRATYPQKYGRHQRRDRLSRLSLVYETSICLYDRGLNGHSQGKYGDKLERHRQTEDESQRATTMGTEERPRHRKNAGTGAKTMHGERKEGASEILQ